MFVFKIMPDADDAEPFDVTAGMRDLRRWEKTTKGRSMGMMTDPGKFSAVLLFEVAHAACTRQGLIGPMTVDEFAERYDIDLQDDVDEDEGDDEDAEGPTR